MLLGRYRYWGCGLDQAPVPQTIQTSDPDLSKGVEPDLWTAIIWASYDELMSGLVMIACFLVSCSAVIHPAKQPSNKLL